MKNQPDSPLATRLLIALGLAVLVYLSFGAGFSFFGGVIEAPLATQLFDFGVCFALAFGVMCLPPKGRSIGAVAAVLLTFATAFLIMRAVVGSYL